MESLQSNLNFCLIATLVAWLTVAEKKKGNLAGDNLTAKNKKVILAREVLICRGSEGIPQTVQSSLGSHTFYENEPARQHYKVFNCF